jgi:hypothetical protein
LKTIEPSPRLRRKEVRRRLGLVGALVLAATGGVVGVSGPASATPSTPFPTPAGCVIQTLTGNYVTAVGGGGQTTNAIHTDATAVSALGAFRIVGAGDGSHVGIQTATGTYVTAVGGGGRTTDVIHTDAQALQDWEKFNLVPIAGQPQDVFAIQTIDGHYLTAVGGGGRTTNVIHTDATAPQGWEWFHFTCNGLNPDGTMTIAPTAQGAGQLPTIRCGISVTQPAVRSIGGLREVTSIGETVCKFKDTDTPAPVLLLDMSHTLYYHGTQASNDRRVTEGLNNVATEPSSFCIAGLYSIFASTTILLPPGYQPAAVIFTPDPFTTNIDRLECLKMPNFNGLAEDSARNAIQQAGLIVGAVTSQPSTTAPVGTVISQSPPVESPTVPGTTVVSLVVSAGNVVMVPQLSLLDQDTAISTIQASGLVFGGAGTIPTDDPASNGLVVNQHPAAGTCVPPGTPVFLDLGRYVPNQCGPEPC